MTEKLKDEPVIISQGILAFIERLKKEGVTAGKQEAQSIIQSAKEEADKIINRAESESERLFNETYDNLQQEKQAFQDALKLAARNMRLDLRQSLIDRFGEEVKRIVHQELSSETTIRQLILMLVIENAEYLQKIKKTEIEIELPKEVLDFEEIRKNPKLLEEDPLKHLVRGVTNQMLKKGVNVKINKESDQAGIYVRITEEGVEMDLTEEAISELLLKHMQPRFRALLEGLLQ